MCVCVCCVCVYDSKLLHDVKANGTVCVSVIVFEKDRERASDRERVRNECTVDRERGRNTCMCT